MKTQSFRRKDGFTLVELLVVIAIIAVLAGVGFAAANSALQKAKKVTAQATCTAVESAVNNFFVEYQSMPEENLSEDTSPSTPIDTKTDKDFLKVLLGTETGNNVLNTRAIKFLAVNQAKKGTNGLLYTGTGTSQVVDGLVDPWGGSYKVVLDGDYDEVVKVKTKAETKESVLNGRRVATWSDGADGVSATGKSVDDVKTW